MATFKHVKFYTKGLTRMMFHMRREAGRAFEEATLDDPFGVLQAVRTVKQTATDIEKYIMDCFDKEVELAKAEEIKSKESVNGSEGPVGNDGTTR